MMEKVVEPLQPLASMAVTVYRVLVGRLIFTDDDGAVGVQLYEYDPLPPLAVTVAEPAGFGQVG